MGIQIIWHILHNYSHLFATVHLIADLRCQKNTKKWHVNICLSFYPLLSKVGQQQEKTGQQINIVVSTNTINNTNAGIIKGGIDKGSLHKQKQNPELHSHGCCVYLFDIPHDYFIALVTDRPLYKWQVLFSRNYPFSSTPPL